MNLDELYRGVRDNDRSGEANALLGQMHWFAANAEFDPKTGEALPLPLSAFLKSLSQPKNDNPICDRLWRIADHSRDSVARLFRALNESPRREHTQLPVHAVRELDAASFIKLSNRPGRNIREKLAGKPYLYAVRRYQSVNLPENRLLKAYAARLLKLLESRRECLGHEDELLPRIQSWLCSDDAIAITDWENLPPNNTLLSHRDYRRVWDSWRWLQTLDDDIGKDFSHRKDRDDTIRHWNEIAQKWAAGEHFIADMPVIFDYDNFEIRLWGSQAEAKESQRKPNRDYDIGEILEPVCIDLTHSHPRYATGEACRSLPHTFVWQRWQSNDEAKHQFVDIELFESDAVYLHPNTTTTTISLPSLIFSKGLVFKSQDLAECAAYSFASKLRKLFINDTLIWLVPDNLNDFELEVLRRNLNTKFPHAEPLPRSVAAVFELFDYSKITRTKEGYPVVVIDFAGSKICVTKLLAKYDPGLEKQLPETRGYYWERCPPVLFKNQDQKNIQIKKYFDFTAVDSEGKWHLAHFQMERQRIDLRVFKDDPRIGEFVDDDCIDLRQCSESGNVPSPVTGGIRFHSWRQQAGDIPLWRDQIPELSIRVKQKNRFQRFYLVSSKTPPVKPIRGKPVSIQVDKTFTLPAGRPFYKFQLFQGKEAEALDYEACLNSPAFPLHKDVECELHLGFEYGANEPYKLVFKPSDGSFLPVQATWQRMGENLNALGPDYPTPVTWEDLAKWPKRNSNETNDLMEWVINSINKLDQELYVRPKQRSTGIIKINWIKDKNDKHFTFAKCNDATEVFIHENDFITGCNFAKFSLGDAVSFELKEQHDGRWRGVRIAGETYQETSHLKKIEEASSLKFVKHIAYMSHYPFIHVWRDGRSIYDDNCPNAFRSNMLKCTNYLTGLLEESSLPIAISNEICFLLSCMHKDAPEVLIQRITMQVNDGKIDNPRTVGFALGDVSIDWQKGLLSALLDQKPENWLLVFANAIWRDQFFCTNFNPEQLGIITDHLMLALQDTLDSISTAHRESVSGVHTPKWSPSLSQLLELLLGLVRTRASSDPEIKSILQPRQKCTRKLARLVDRIAEIADRENITIRSRLVISSPESGEPLDLLFALQLYLSGDDGANAIQITGVSDSDEG